MSKRQSYDRRRRLSSKHLVLIAVLAVFGAGGTFAMVNGTANAALRHNGRQHGHTNKNQGKNGAGTGAGASASASASAGASAPAGGTGQAGARANGPVDADFVDITTVTPNVVKPQKLAGATTGSFVAKCGKNENKHFNPDNFIVAPGVANGAQHTHDYVGNLTTDGFSTNQTLAAGGTTCANNDKSAYFWPVLRNLSANDQPGADNNTGTILTPSSVTIRFKGSTVAKVTAM
ncbi:MAG: hypothetical protein QOI83_4296, partial [Streptomycetaceae bacterium]|nr:hypothetical protein [Streptomycetaceae bacterium]